MKFITKNSSHFTLRIDYKERFIQETVKTKVHDWQINNHVNCKNQIDEMIPKLKGASYAIRSMVHISNTNTLKSIYYAYFHSLINME
jgi:hypothetical protein